jgi:putative Ca2+/H+ antiporter (TMEM165/GDT1 family)
MAPYPRLVGRLLGSISLRVGAMLSVACLVGTIANYTLVQARWLTLLTVAGWLLIGWRMAWEAQADLERRGARRRRVSTVVVAAIVWTIVQIGPLFAHYPAPEYRLNAVIGGIAFVYLWLAFFAAGQIGGLRVIAEPGDIPAR